MWDLYYKKLEFNASFYTTISIKYYNFGIPFSMNLIYGIISASFV